MFFVLFVMLLTKYVISLQNSIKQKKTVIFGVGCFDRQLIWFSSVSQATNKSNKVFIS